MSVPVKRVEIEIDPNSGLQPFFTLDDATFGILDDPTGDSILGSLAYADVTEFVVSIDTDRGASRVLDKFNAGGASVVFDNTTRIFDPLNAASPYSEQLLPRRGIKIYSGDENVFTGIVEDWNLNYDPSGNNTTVAMAADRFTLLAQQNLTAHTAAVQYSGQRINTILSRPEVDWSATDRNIDTGYYQMQADVVNENAVVLDYLNLVSQSESGNIFIAKNGYFTFQDALTGPNSSNLLTFADDGTGVQFRELQVVFGSELLYNRITLTRVNGTAQIVEDLTSQEFYGITTYEQSDLLNSNDLDVLEQANSLLNKYSTPEYRFNTITIEMAELSSPQQLLVLDKELTDTVFVKFTPNNIGDPIEKYARIIGIKHTIGNFSHLVTFNLDTLDYAPFVLDDAQFGILGGSLESYDLATLSYDDTIAYDGTQNPDGNRLG
jgi:hypothetical protein